MAVQKRRPAARGRTRPNVRKVSRAVAKTSKLRKKTQSKGNRRRARDTGTIGQAAAKVVKSGTRLVGHASKRMIAAGAKAAMETLEGAMHSVTERVHKITQKRPPID
jgi:hypothetical protein